MPRQTTFAKAADVEPKWHHVDADGEILGRLASDVAVVLMGKHRPEYTPHVECGDYVVVTNAARIRLTGNKPQHKVFQSYSGYPSGRKVRTYAEMLEKHPERVIENAVRRMLPKNRLATQMLRKLKVYAGPEHPHGRDVEPLARRA